MPSKSASDSAAIAGQIGAAILMFAADPQGAKAQAEEWVRARIELQEIEAQRHSTEKSIEEKTAAFEKTEEKLAAENVRLTALAAEIASEKAAVVDRETAVTSREECVTDRENAVAERERKAAYELVARLSAAVVAELGR